MIKTPADTKDGDVAELPKEQVILKNCPVPVPRVKIDLCAALIASVYNKNPGAYPVLLELCAKGNPTLSDKIAALEVIDQDSEVVRSDAEVEMDFAWLFLTLAAASIENGRLVINYTKVETVPTAGP